MSLLLGYGGRYSINHAQTGSSAQASRGRRQLTSSNSYATLLNLVRNPAESVGQAVGAWYDGTTSDERCERQRLEDKKQILYVKMREATTYSEWEAAAMELDILESNNEWKRIFSSSDYDAPLVEARLKQLDDARISCDVERMLFLIRTSLTRDLGDMGNLRMYKHSHVGTKDLVERYINSALETMDTLLSVSAKAKCDAMESKYLLEQVLSSRQAFGRSALLLSGGATFGMNHIGVLKALWESKLLPRIISGASAGSIVGAVICTRTDEEVPYLLSSFCEGDLDVFDEKGNEDGVLRKVARFLKHGALFDISHLTRVMKEMLGDMTFQEAYNRTRKILNICVSSASLYELPRLLNYVTAPNVLIWSAVAASCSVPFIYTAASLLAKDPKTGEAVEWNPSPQRWIDGSVDNDIPMTRLAEMFNVNHFIVSQVNPHVVPFLKEEEKTIEQEALQSATTSSTLLNNLSHLAKGEVLHRMHTLAELGFLPNLLTKTVSVLSQKYSGDITIFPEIAYADFPYMLSNPSPEFMHQAMLSGQRATWPKMSIIKNHCAIELALDNAVQKLRARVVFSPSEVETRLTGSVIQRDNLQSHQRDRNRIGKRRSSRDSEPPGEEYHISSHKITKSNGSTPSLPTDRHRRGRLSPSNRHKKNLSISTLASPPTTDHSNQDERPHTAGSLPQRPKPPSEDLANDLLSPPKHLHDITSSGAEEETSNLDQSSPSTSLDLSSPNEGDLSPAEPSSRWSRALYGSSSQPGTPAELAGLSLPSHMRGLGIDTTPAPSTPSTDARSRETSPESRYRRFLPHRGSRLKGGSTSSGKPSTARGSPVSERSRRNWGMQIAIPTSAKGFGRSRKGEER